MGRESLKPSISPTHKWSTADLCGIYNRFAPRYDLHLLWLEHIAGLRRLRRKLLQRACGDVLDVATGTGINFSFFPPPCTVTGIDLSEHMLAKAKARAEQLKRTVKLQVMDAEELAFPPESFDTIVSSLALCTIPHPLRALQEMSRVCRRKGKVLLLEHGPSEIPIIATAQKFFVGEWHVRKYGCHWDREPDQLVEQAGLPLRSHRRQFFGILHAIEAAKKV